MDKIAVGSEMSSSISCLNQLGQFNILAEIRKNLILNSHRADNVICTCKKNCTALAGLSHGHAVYAQKRAFSA